MWARHPHCSFKRFEWGWGWAGTTAALPKEVKDVANGSWRPPQEESGGRGRKRPIEGGGTMFLHRRCLEEHLSWVEGSVWAKFTSAHKIFALGLPQGVFQEVALEDLHRALLSGSSWKEMTGTDREDWVGTTPQAGVGDKEVEDVESRRRPGRRRKGLGCSSFFQDGLKTWERPRNLQRENMP